MAAAIASWPRDGQYTHMNSPVPMPLDSRSSAAFINTIKRVHAPLDFCWVCHGSYDPISRYTRGMGFGSMARFSRPVILPLAPSSPSRCTAASRSSQSSS